MTTIITKPVRESSKARRYRQRGEHMRALKVQCESDRILAKRIDRAFAKLSGEGSERVVKALSLPGLRHPEQPSRDNCCLPEVAIYAVSTTTARYS